MSRKSQTSILLMLAVIACLVFIAGEIHLRKEQAKIDAELAMQTLEPTDAPTIVPTTTPTVMSTAPGIGVQETQSPKITSVPNKVVVLGNSILMGTNDKPSGNFGMAASDPQHDYFYLVKTFLQKYNPNLEMTRLLAKPWEGLASSQARTDWFNDNLKSNIAPDSDLVIIQLVDNVNTAEKEATFADDAITLINQVKNRCPNAMIIWVAGWFVDDKKMGEVRSACEKTGALLCDITAYNIDPIYKGAIGSTITRTDGTSFAVKDPNVAKHPGDIGMQKIAEAIESMFQFS